MPPGCGFGVLAHGREIIIMAGLTAFKTVQRSEEYDLGTRIRI